MEQYDRRMVRVDGSEQNGSPLSFLLPRGACFKIELTAGENVEEIFSPKAWNTAASEMDLAIWNPE